LIALTKIKHTLPHHLYHFESIIHSIHPSSTPSLEIFEAYLLEKLMKEGDQLLIAREELLLSFCISFDLKLAMAFYELCKFVR